MSQILDRIGAFTFMQVSIEVWNEIFLLILISVMMIGIRHDRTDELQKKIKIPLTQVQSQILCKHQNRCKIKIKIYSGGSGFVRCRLFA